MSVTQRPSAATVGEVGETPTRLSFCMSEFEIRVCAGSQHARSRALYRGNGTAARCDDVHECTNDHEKYALRPKPAHPHIQSIPCSFQVNSSELTSPLQTDERSCFARPPESTCLQLVRVLLCSATLSQMGWFKDATVERKPKAC